MSITVQSRAWTEGKIRGNLCVLANNRTGHQTGGSWHAARHPSFSLSLSLSASPSRALTLWPQFRVVSHKVKSISPESGRPEFHQYLGIHIYATYRRRVTHRIGMIRDPYFPPSLSPSLLSPLYVSLF